MRPVRTAALAAATLLLILPARGESPQARVREEGSSALQPEGLTSSEVCAACHEDIHAGWAESVHGRAFVDPVFQKALEGLAARGSASKRPMCLSCHAPATLVTKDAAGTDPLTREGVTCAFCHSIQAAADTWSPTAFTLDPGPTMRGPFRYAESTGHPTEFSPLHRSARLCAPCHQLTNEAGVAVLDTYREWSKGPWQAQGVQCQDCHMAPIPGAVAASIPKPAVANAQDRRIVNLHKLVGGSAIGQLRRALSAKIRDASRSQGTVTAVVLVRNDAAGHRAPTGLPTRSIVLTLAASKGGKVFHTEERVYRRDLLDKNGRRIVADAEVFLGAAKVGRDTRLGPGESRAETFRFAAPPGPTKLVITLDYVTLRGAGAAPEKTRFQEAEIDVK